MAVQRKSFKFVIMNMKCCWLLVLLFSTNVIVAQKIEGFRINVRAALAEPLGDFANNDEAAIDNGFARTGLDVNMGVELFVKKWLSLGVRGGYSLYQLDDSNLKDTYKNKWGFSPEANTTPYQNIYVLGGGGINIPVVKEKFEIQPYMYAGLNIFKSAGKELFGNSNGVQYFYSNESNFQPGLQLQPGMSFNVYLNNFAEFQVFSEYNHSGVTIEETIREGGVNQISNKKVDYSLSAMHVGAGLTFRF